MEQKILFFTFLGIFIITAGVSLASLPGYLKIPETYRKKLFVMLLLEVTACVLLLFKMNFLQLPEKSSAIVTQPDNWIALNLNTGKPGDVSVELPGDTLIVLSNSESDMDNTTLDFHVSAAEKGLNVFLESDSSFVLGSIHRDELAEAGFYSSLIIPDNIDDIAMVEFFPFDSNKSTNGLYKLKKFPDPIQIKVKRDPSGVLYDIWVDNDGDRVLVCKQEPVDSRKPHLIHVGNNFYFFTVTEADFSNSVKNKSVSFLVVRMSGIMGYGVL